MASENDNRVTFEELVAEIRKDAPGRGAAGRNPGRLLVPERGVNLTAQLAAVRHAEIPLRRF
jgi:hypothetical protein